MDIEKQMKDILVEVIENQIIADVISADTNLIDEVGLDSLQMINFILMLEDKFDVEIDFDEIEYEMFLRFDLLVEYIKEKLNQ